ncbi:MAG: GDP-mannose 4,6-dehydratase [Planctomycetaceae bacterium]|jgi:UDP-glucose 4-epimerase|nr:GDP-mannose 4,6-dehydratase [Planctomycetaceae bacterium]
MNTYLITGGAGFIGSHLAERLLEAGERVTVLDDLSTGSWRNIAHLERNPNFRAIIASADDARLITDEMPRHSHVFHLASAVGVRLVVDRPVETVQRIVRTTDVIVEAAARYRRPVLLTSTSEVYGKLNDVPFREDSDTIMGATSKRRWAYACAKALDEFLLLAHHAQTSLPVFIVRLFNTVGVRQSGQYGMVLPSFIEAARRGEPLQVFGNGEQTRCFCSVHDVVGGLIKIMNCPNAVGKVVNLGSQEEISIKSLAELVIGVTNSKSKIIYKTYQDAYGNGFDDMLRRVPCLQRAGELINWKPTKKLEEIIREIYENGSTS